ncbi:hypothetical protein CL621_00210 [archaeon]|nr:hypothetical protein [archaeon]|tara:strand:+ start:85 stop:333 length:249 start_codon:yes stop_codon:yes gene_type:complete
MAFGDWILARSEAFKLMMIKFRDHKHDTMDAFSKVKRKHKEYDSKLNEQESKITELANIMRLLQEGMSEKPKVVRGKGRKKS